MEHLATKARMDAIIQENANLKAIDYQKSVQDALDLQNKAHALGYSTVCGFEVRDHFLLDLWCYKKGGGTLLHVGRGLIGWSLSTYKVREDSWMIKQTSLDSFTNDLPSHLSCLPYLRDCLETQPDPAPKKLSSKTLASLSKARKLTNRASQLVVKKERLSILLHNLFIADGSEESFIQLNFDIPLENEAYRPYTAVKGDFQARITLTPNLEVQGYSYTSWENQSLWGVGQSTIEEVLTALRSANANGITNLKEQYNQHIHTLAMAPKPDMSVELELS